MDVDPLFEGCGSLRQGGRTEVDRFGRMKVVYPIGGRKWLTRDRWINMDYFISMKGWIKADHPFWIV